MTWFQKKTYPLPVDKLYSRRERIYTENTVEFLDVCEKLYNPDFIRVQFEAVKQMETLALVSKEGLNQLRSGNEDA